LDVSAGTFDAAVEDRVPRRDLVPGSLGPLVQRWWNGLVRLPTTATLTVTSDPPDASIALDGKPMGTTPQTLRELLPGVHTLTLSQPGRQPTTRTVELRAGGTHEIQVALEAVPKPVEAKPVAPVVKSQSPLAAEPVAPAPKHPSSHPGRAAIMAGTVLLVSAVALGSVTLAYFLSSRDDQERASNLSNQSWVKADAARVTHCNMMPRPSDCDPAQAGGLSSEENVRYSMIYTQVNSLNSSGNQKIDIVNGLTPAWIGLAAGGAIALGVGLYQKTHASKPVGVIRQSLYVAPGLGGSIAGFQF
jgi:hypothetical protein